MKEKQPYILIPMSDITDEAREIAKAWYDGVSEMNDIREKHKLASDIMNYAKNQIPTDEESEKWYEENIGINNDCSASSAIYKFRLWLRDRLKYKK
jgi:hypothetical protein